MNTSKRWQVAHEPDMGKGNQPGWSGHVLASHVGLVANRWRNRMDPYGEVNSYLRHVILDIPVEMKGVIIRDPHDILLSAINWTARGTITRSQLDLIALGYQALDRAIQHDDVVPIRFERMTTDVAYLQDLLGTFGIDDVTVSEEILAKKVNASPVLKVRRYPRIEAGIRHYYEKQTNWYREKYYGSC